MKNGVPMVSDRTIRNYVALLKSIGLKFVAKPQLRDLKVHVNRCSFRNACTTYCRAFITHEGLSPYMIMNIDPTTVVFGYKDNSFSAAVVPVGSEIPTSLVGLKGHSIPHSVKILPMANLAGSVGPMVFLFKVSKIEGESDLVKIPLLGCHPNTGVGPFKSYLWLYSDKPLADIMTEYYREFIPLFLNESRKVLTDFKCEEQGAALWVDCGQDVSAYFTTDAGVKWAEDLNLSVNMPAKYTGVVQQLDQTNAFRGLCFTFCVSCFLFFSLGTKQAIKSHVYDQLEVNDVLRKCLKDGMKGKVKLGAVKHQILQFLTQLTVVLPKSFWYTLLLF